MAGMCILLASCLYSCGEPEWTGEDVTSTTLGINTDGSVLEVVVEDFDKDYYDLDELRETIESDIADYNGSGDADDKDAPIKLLDVAMEGSSVRTRTTYAGTNDYGRFTREPLYYGTVRQSGFSGFEMPSILDSGGGEDYAVSSDDYDKHVIFSDGHDRIIAPYKIIAVSKGVRLISETEADLSETEGRSALLLIK